MIDLPITDYFRLARVCFLCWFLTFGCAVWAPAAEPVSFQRNDVVGSVGGADVAAAQHDGQLETLLAVRFRGMGVRFRNFGWEGDTVFEQPRDFAFPSLLTNLQKAGVTVVVLQFGRTEALDRKHSVAEFRGGYAKLLDQWAPKFRQLILVTPVPFENGGSLLPNLKEQNPRLAERAEAIRQLARDRNLPLVDLFEPLSGHSELRLTSDGLQLTPAGHAKAAGLFFQNVQGHEAVLSAAESAGFEPVRQAVLAKNRLWFDYSRPQNWAFLGGDRTTQPSSRDHRDPKVRWFPKEMEKFLPLIAEAEKRIDEAAAKAMP
jgi:hypothetical protein